MISEHDEATGSSPLTRRSLLARAGAAVAVAASGPGARPLRKPDWRDFPAFIRYLETSTNPVAKQVLKQIAAGPKELEREQALCRAAGIPLTPRELSVPPAPPADKDAYPIYLRLAALLREKPLDRRTLDLAEALGHRRAQTSEETAAVRQMFETRRDVMDLAHEAVSRPFFGFRRDWSRVAGSDFQILDLFTPRRASLLIKAESILMARQGREREAVALYSRVFIAVSHAQSDPLVVSWMLAQSIARSALSGMEELLYASGGKPELADQVQRTVLANRQSSTLKRALEGETLFMMSVYAAARRCTPDQIARFMWDDEVGEPDPPTEPTPSYTERERRFLVELLQAKQARALRGMRMIISALDKAPAARERLLRKAGSVPNPMRNPVLEGAEAHLGLFTGLPRVSEQKTAAREEVVIAAAALLAYRGKHGHFPARLNEIPPIKPRKRGLPVLEVPLAYRREGTDGFVVYYPVEFDPDLPGKKYDGGRPAIQPAWGQVRFRWPAPPALPPPPLRPPFIHPPPI